MKETFKDLTSLIGFWHVLFWILVVASSSGCGMIEQIVSDLSNPRSSPSVSVATQVARPIAKPRIPVVDENGNDAGDFDDAMTMEEFRKLQEEIRQWMKDHPGEKMHTPVPTAPDAVADKVSERLADPLGRLNDSIAMLNTSIESQTKMLESMDTRSKLAMRKIDEKLTNEPPANIPDPNFSTIYFYPAPFPCERCRHEESDIKSVQSIQGKETNPRFEIRPAPAWTKGHAFPVNHWKKPDGTWTSRDGYKSLSWLLNEYNTSMGIKYEGGKAAGSASSAQAVGRTQPAVSYLHYGMYPSVWDWKGNLRTHICQWPHNLSPITVSTWSDRQCVAWHDQWHNGHGSTDKPCGKIHFAQYVPPPDPTVPPPAAPAPEGALKANCGAPAYSAPRSDCGGVSAVQGPPWWNNRIWHFFKSSGPMYASDCGGAYASGVMAVSTHRAARLQRKIDKWQARLNNHAARVAYRSSYGVTYYNTAPRGFFQRLFYPRVRVRTYRAAPIYRSYGYGICPTC